MIVTERYLNSTDLVRTYSNAGMKIIQDETGILYDEAVDPEYMNRTYTESNIPVDPDEYKEPQPNPNGEISDTEALNIILGR